MNKQEIEFLKESNAIEREYSEEAFEDARQAWIMAQLASNEPMNISYFLGIHRRLLKRLNPKIAGKLRKVQVGVMTKKGFKEAIHWSSIEEELRLLCNPGLYPTFSEKLIKRWHIQFEKIHPFEDGNGRIGRILMNIQRIKAGLPILVIYEKEKHEYYKWFK